jgi:hypothetical protein
MLKIVEVHTTPRAQSEYVVLQNQGLVNVNLRGWALCTDAFLEADTRKLVDEMYVFREDVQIKPYARVVLFTGRGENEWMDTIDGKHAYCVYWCRNEPIWGDAGSVNVLHMLTTRRVVSQVPQSPTNTVAQA